MVLESCLFFLVFMQFMDSRINDCARVLLENLGFVGRDVCPPAM